MKKIYINPQWQGGDDLSTYAGAEEIKMYLSGQEYVALPVSTDKSEVAIKKNGIKGFDILCSQMQSAYDRLQADSPEKIFTLGGGCDADVPAIVYMCEKYQRDITLVWLDAHGDLNRPEESETALFYGMPLRSVMDADCFGLLENKCPMRASRVIHIGGRDFDEVEKVVMSETGMSAYSVQDIHSRIDQLHKIAEEVNTKHVYIHLDLDVLDPADFPNTPLPAPDGLHCEEVSSILDAFADKLVGLGIYEYAPAGEKNPFIEKLIQFGLEF